MKVIVDTMRSTLAPLQSITLYNSQANYGRMEIYTKWKSGLLDAQYKLWLILSVEMDKSFYTEKAWNEGDKSRGGDLNSRNPVCSRIHRPL